MPRPSWTFLEESNWCDILKLGVNKNGFFPRGQTITWIYYVYIYTLTFNHKTAGRDTGQKYLIKYGKQTRYMRYV